MNSEEPLMSAVPSVPLFKVDAFTDRPFRGNPAAVCVPTKPLDADLMQCIAAEMNLSETAFVGSVEPDGTRGLRWFTPAVEVPLCGHATLATAHVLLNELGQDAPLRFQTLSGVLEVDREEGGWLRMDFPADPPEPAVAPAGMLEALGCPAETLSHRAVKGWILRLDSVQEVLEVNPDFTRLGQVEVGSSSLGAIVTAPGNEGLDFVSRFFGPWVGVDEDPVTGMAHTILGPYWAAELGKTDMTARQISKRGGELRVRVFGDRVHIAGQAVTVARGNLEV
jgi:PhzF family phenazine biosynthesis protein